MIDAPKNSTNTDGQKVRLKTSAMIASIVDSNVPTKSAPFGHALSELAREDESIVAMTADLGKYTDLHIFAEKHPDKYYQMGMAEQLLISSAAGMAREGHTVFATTYAVFASRRAYDFICIAIAEEKLNVKIVCALPGLTTGYGPSHQATEDIAIFRGMPNLTIIDPCDATEIEQATNAISAYDGPVYMRLLRGKVPNILDKYNYQFVLGKAQRLVDGNDVLFISSGLMTMRTLEATESLKENNINCAVLHISTIKPLDEQSILDHVGRGYRLVVVVENHSVIGGLGEAVAYVLMTNNAQCNYKHIALPDEFLAAGALPTLHDRYGISTASIIASVKKWLS